MKYMTGSEIRSMYLNFFKSKGHMIEPGAPLVPINDPSLLWINSGVAALKKYFDGREIPNNPRITNAQKSIRTNDIENVGKTARHHTFFEMLGNFSIGDYFREEAVTWGWELLTSKEWFGFDKELLYVTVYPTDQETYDLWIKLGVSPDHIVKLEYNFWEIGEGPCGPNTEIFYDRGTKYDPENIGIRLLEEDIENDRYIEIWNIVFSQYNSKEGLDRSEYPMLPNKNIDTGMGLERMACVIQGVETNFDTDLFMPIIRATEEMSGVKYTQETATAFKVIADHVRTVTFAVADGALLSNEGRGYVLRRLLRRAVRYGKKLGIDRAFMYELVPVVADIMKDYYPYVCDKIELVQKVIKSEEDRFRQTLADGEKILTDLIAKCEDKTISGKDAFMLYDTYGFPYELTLEYAEEAGFTVDKEGFDAQMEAQRERARNAREDVESMHSQNAALMSFKTPSKFVGYHQLSTTSNVILLLQNGEVVDSLTGAGQVILDTTPFYAESGGQVADTGMMTTSAANVMVTDVIKAPNGQHLHSVQVDGTLSLNDEVVCQVQVENRLDLTKNHTATHLLHQALKDVIGAHANQAGSLVSADRLRFDFTNMQGLTSEELQRIEAIVNEKIWASIPVEVFEKSIEEAKQMGAMALFSEKYGETVRVVKAGDYSIELCGGCHVSNTSEIGLFKIISESGIGAGTRRIEAVTGKGAYQYMNSFIERFAAVSETLKTKPALLEERVEGILDELKEAHRENDSLKSKLSHLKMKEIVNNTREVAGITVLTANLVDVDMNHLRQMVDEFKQQLSSAVIVLASAVDGKVAISCGVTPDYVKQGVHAGKIVKEVATICGGGGGGRPDMAQAGAKDATKIEEALKNVDEWLKNNL
ncbi:MULTISPECIES: alanine--tRNA ligase [Turicibacter]|uniref:alanine--tRNA ligase n=2 Tax=Turicibacteraceae TaxID=2810281 RepID=UPI0006C42708|nr:MULTISPECIES: alanine--tRNA ligase [Turicibacter]MBP3903625.1 alanine--tRNA ligase [Turicibacter sp.]MCU7196669.1 alanine--tRNA ligase [Turicibacter sanguinis]MCU7201948.1 alanine--tRNA ligase [Turicibacter sanguinis]MCU7212851.1 alanine--tRNA ligase [Turicibacter sanguinis]MDB8438709.1 alanine--tRNA ligase [Turicibacter sanguinis]